MHVEVVDFEEDATQDDSNPETDKETDLLEENEDPDVADIQGRQARMLHNFSSTVSVTTS